MFCRRQVNGLECSAMFLCSCLVFRFFSGKRGAFLCLMVCLAMKKVEVPGARAQKIGLKSTYLKI